MLLLSITNFYLTAGVMACIQKVVPSLDYMFWEGVGLRKQLVQASIVGPQRVSRGKELQRIIKTNVLSLPTPSK